MTRSIHSATSGDAPFGLGKPRELHRCFHGDREPKLWVARRGTLVSYAHQVNYLCHFFARCPDPVLKGADFRVATVTRPHFCNGFLICAPQRIAKRPRHAVRQVFRAHAFRTQASFSEPWRFSCEGAFGESPAHAAIGNQELAGSDTLQDPFHDHRAGDDHVGSHGMKAW